MVIDAGTVVPALIRYLSCKAAPALQFEVAWSLTNIACGEARHIHCLLSLGALQELMNVVVTSKDVALKDQALWAICNMTSAAEACEYVLNLPNLLVALLQQIGLRCEIYCQNSNTIHDTFTSNNCVLRRIFQFEVKENPTLSAMRHVTFICGNIAR